MWNLIVQNIVGLIFVAALVLTIRSKSVKKRIGWSIILGVTLIGIILLAQNRIENIFYSFPTAESVADYACGNDVLDVVDGNDSSLIIYSDNEGVIKTMITPRQKSGYKIGSDFHKKNISSDYSHGYLVDILGYEDVEDCYVTIIGTVDTPEVSVEDSMHSEFVISTMDGIGWERGRTRFLALAFIEEYTEEYSVVITSGGESITIDF